jgi:Domain of unknown function (DUF5666)
MRLAKRRCLSLGLTVCLGILEACTPSGHQAPSTAVDWLPGVAPATPNGCHVTASGRPDELAERGIGGTGGAVLPPPPGPIVASLGVAGLIDGFGSVCLNGLEVSLLPGTTVMTDGVPAGPGDLRIGQEAVLAAGWAGGRPVTDRLLIRHAVIGPIEEANGNRLIVAGQTVWLSRTAWIEAPLRPGQWVSVSGLHTPSGEIIASRVDGAAGPTELLIGRVQGTPAEPRIGSMAIMVPDGDMKPGSDVMLRGVEDQGRLRVIEMKPDLLTDDPGALFDGGIRHFLIQTLVGPRSGPTPAAKPGFAPPTAVSAIMSVTVTATGVVSTQMPNAAVAAPPGPPGSAPPGGANPPGGIRGGAGPGHGAPGAHGGPGSPP